MEELEEIVNKHRELEKRKRRLLGEIQDFEYKTKVYLADKKLCELLNINWNMVLRFNLHR